MEKGQDAENGEDHGKKGSQEPKQGSNPPAKPKVSLVLIFLLLFTAFYVYTIVVKPKTSVSAEDGNTYLKYRGEIIPLRTTIGECKSVPIRPGAKEIAQSLANTKRVILLIDPYTEDKYYTVNLGQIALIVRSKYLQKPLTYAYTQEYENTTEPIPPDVMSLDYGNANHAVILLNRTKETGITMEKDGQILVGANESKEYDRAVCALELSVLGVI